MTTVADLIGRTQQHLYGTYRPVLVPLAEQMDHLIDHIRLSVSTAIVNEGDVLSCEGEAMYVLGITHPDLYRVLRGWLGSIPAFHTVGSPVEVSPRFTSSSIFEALRDELRSWPDNLYQVCTSSLQIDPGQTTVEGPAWLCRAYGLIDVRWRTTKMVDSWQPVPRLKYARLVRVDDVVSSGILVTLGETPVCPTTVHLTAAMPFGTEDWTLATDAERDIGLMASQLDVPPLGAALRLVAPQDIPRSTRDVQGDTRRADEVPATFVTQLVKGFETLLLRRRKEESDKLYARFPIRVD